MEVAALHESVVARFDANGDETEEEIARQTAAFRERRRKLQRQFHQDTLAAESRRVAAAAAAEAAATAAAALVPPPWIENQRAASFRAGVRQGYSSAKAADELAAHPPSLISDMLLDQLNSHTSSHLNNYGWDSIPSLEIFTEFVSFGTGNPRLAHLPSALPDVLWIDVFIYLKLDFPAVRKLTDACIAHFRQIHREIFLERLD